MKQIVLFACCLIFPNYSFGQLYRSNFATSCDIFNFDSASSDTLEFIILKELPRPKFTSNQIEFWLNRNIDIDSFNLENGDRFYITFGINCEGEVFAYQFNRCNDSVLSAKLVENIDGKLFWKPAIKSYKPVDIKMTLPFKIADNQIRITNIESLRSKHNKRR